MQKNPEVYNSSEQEFDLGILSYNLNTLSGNYGALLHSFAFQKYLDKLGVKSVIVSYAGFVFKDFIKGIIFNNFPSGFIRAVFITLKRLMFADFYKRNKCVFTKNEYNFENIETIKNIKKYCCETDVTWACTSKGYNRIFMCDYPNMKNKENIAYSVDYGSCDIPPELESLKEYAKNFKYISIRHPSRLEAFKKQIEREDVVATIDPVFLLEEKDYLPYFKDIKSKEDYVFVYNCKEYSKDMIKQAKQFAKEHNCKIKIVNCCDQLCERRSHRVPTPITPEAFLRDLKNSRYVLTNSYHAICFSIIFKKEFYAFQRIANNGKIETLLDISGLRDRFVEDGKFSTNKINYDEVEKKMKPMIEFSKEWLNKALGL